MTNKTNYVAGDKKIMAGKIVRVLEEGRLEQRRILGELADFRVSRSGRDRDDMTRGKIDHFFKLLKALGKDMAQTARLSDGHDIKSEHPHVFNNQPVSSGAGMQLAG